MIENVGCLYRSTPLSGLKIESDTRESVKNHRWSSRFDSAGTTYNQYISINRMNICHKLYNLFRTFGRQTAQTAKKSKRAQKKRIEGREVFSVQRNLANGGKRFCVFFYTSSVFILRDCLHGGREILTPYVFFIQYKCKRLYLSLALGSFQRQDHSR